MVFFRYLAACLKWCKFQTNDKLEEKSKECMRPPNEAIKNDLNRYEEAKRKECERYHAHKTG